MAKFPGATRRWFGVSSGQTVPGAVVGGHESSGEPIYIARAYHGDALIPGKLVVSHGCAYVSWGGQEHGKTEYEVLVGSYKWVPTTGSNIPTGAFPGGQSENGEPLFVGRVHHQGTITTGKVQKSQGACYIPFNGEEIRAYDYEILTYY